MININELRRGNYILYPNRESAGLPCTNIGQVYNIIDHCISFQNDTNSYSCLTIDPIPLTEEMLLQCGFELCQHYNGWAHEDIYPIIARNTGEGYWRLHPFDNVHDNKLYLTSEREYTISDKPIEYLHQLQNLYFALIGNDLAIEL